MKKYSNLTEESYNKAAQKYHNLFKDELDSKEYDRDLLIKFSRNLPKKARILDAGCGPSGHIGKFLHDLGHRVTGIDISEECIKIASDYNKGMDFFKMDMSDLGFNSESFEGIVSFYSIIHVPKKLIPGFFQEFKRVLKKGGKLLVSVKSGDSEEYLNNFLGSKIKIFFTHFNTSEIEKYFTDTGFKMIFLEERSPYEDEIDVKRIYAVGEKK